MSWGGGGELGGRGGELEEGGGVMGVENDSVPMYQYLIRDFSVSRDQMIHTMLSRKLSHYNGLQEGRHFFKRPLGSPRPRGLFFAIGRTRTYITV